jgi:hypothetical protein
MTYEITVSTFEQAGSGFDMRGIITNLRSEATTVPPLTFEFVNEQGDIVQTIVLDGQTLEADGIAPFALAPVGEGMAAWRYRAES